MRNYSIKDLERFTSIKAHTLRIWELRYGIPKSFRSRNNTRYYTFDEIEYILNLSILKRNGYRISCLTTLSRTDIQNTISKLTRDDQLKEVVICNLLYTMVTQRTEEFEFILDECFKKWSAPIVLDEILVPFLHKGNLFWHGNHLTEEHLVVTVIRKKILFAIELIKQPVKNNQKVLLFLNDSSQLDLALLYTYFCLRNKGMGVIYLGNDVSIQNLSEVWKTAAPQYIYTYLPQKNNFPFETLLSVMNKQLPLCTLLVTLYPDHEIPNAKADNIIFANMDDVLILLTSVHKPAMEH